MLIESSKLQPGKFLELATTLFSRAFGRDGKIKIDHFSSQSYRVEAEVHPENTHVVLHFYKKGSGAFVPGRISPGLTHLGGMRCSFADSTIDAMVHDQTEVQRALAQIVTLETTIKDPAKKLLSLLEPLLHKDDHVVTFSAHGLIVAVYKFPDHCEVNVTKFVVVPGHMHLASGYSGRLIFHPNKPDMAIRHKSGDPLLLADALANAVTAAESGKLSIKARASKHHVPRGKERLYITGNQK